MATGLHIHRRCRCRDCGMLRLAGKESWCRVNRCRICCTVTSAARGVRGKLRCTSALQVELDVFSKHVTRLPAAGQLCHRTENTLSLKLKCRRSQRIGKNI